MRICSAILFLFMGMLAGLHPAQACSVGSDYHLPSTLELVASADTIVLARVADGGPAGGGFTRARLVPFALLKGGTLPEHVLFDQAMLSDSRLKATASDPRNLVDANPDAFAGGCNRFIFDRGMIILAFLERSGDAFIPLAPPFSRALEDVPSPDALWVKAVKLYVRIAALPEARRRKAMEEQQIELRNDLDDPDARLLGLELDRALREQR